MAAMAWWTSVRASCCLLLLLAVLLPGGAAAGELDERVPVGPASRLRIELDEGRVTVVTHEASEVRIEARARGLGASAYRFQLREEAGAARSTWAAWRSHPSTRAASTRPAVPQG